MDKDNTRDVGVQVRWRDTETIGQSQGNKWTSYITIHMEQYKTRGTS